jgi:hypothetical protein
MMTPTSIEAHVDATYDGGQTWRRQSVPLDPYSPDQTQDAGPWFVPYAVEVGRRVWAGLVNAPFPARVRVVDLADTVVEQWPKHG